MHSFQGNNCEIASTNGSLRQTHQRTITSHVVLITRKQQTGFSKEEYTKNGSQQVRFSGPMENVRLVPFRSRYALIMSCNVAGSGKSILWFVDFLLSFSEVTDFSCQFVDHPRYREHVQRRKCINGIFLFGLSGRQQTRVARSRLFPSHPAFCSLGSSFRPSIKSLFGSRRGQEAAK